MSMCSAKIPKKIRTSLPLRAEKCGFGYKNGYMFKIAYNGDENAFFANTDFYSENQKVEYGSVNVGSFDFIE